MVAIALDDSKELKRIERMKQKEREILIQQEEQR
jgi:hypothetical protein